MPYCASLRRMEPLEVELRSTDHSLFWSLGPFNDGIYHFVFDDGRRAYEIPRWGGFQMGSLPAVALRVKFTSRAGWSTYSPVLNLALDHDSQLRWSRASGAN